LSEYRYVYLSPHLDDVALSCGGRIYQLAQAGEAVLVVTVFAGSPHLGEGEGDTAASRYVAALHQRWEAELDAPALRRKEDEAAMRLLGADFCHLSHVDCIYRRHPVTNEFLYLSDEDIFAQVHPSEFTLAARLREELDELVGVPGEAMICSPLTAGHHVDHQITAASALALQASGHRVAFYEDYPYAETPIALAAARRWVGGEHWRQEFFALRQQDLVAKVTAVLQYRSQLSTFFDDGAEVAQRLQAYAMSSHGEAAESRLGPSERVWHLTK
jgi:LmbE family N-acetylglucosaminyl deacetylase